MKRAVAHVVSHTHWDREWYLPFERFRLRLVDLIDNLIEIMDRDPSFRVFMLDGQTVVLEDYLEIKPDKAETLKRLIGAGRIQIGPWYMLPDEFLIGEESHVRNLLFGDKVCKQFGGKMLEGYLPDSFGHIGQMPQILAGFGIESAVFWRGLSHNIKHTEFTWEAPDGTAVLAVNMPFGYCTGAALQNDAGLVSSRMQALLSRLEKLSHIDQFLVMNGCDHLEAQPDLPRILDLLNQRDSGVSEQYEFRHSSLSEFVSAARYALSQSNAQLEKHIGELRSGDKHYLLGSTISTRNYIKVANTLCENLLVKWVEPFSAFQTLLGRKPRREAAEYAWKLLLKNHPHDSICGCSIDEVHKEMETRFEKVLQVGSELKNQALADIAGFIDTSDVPGIAHVHIFNPTTTPYTGTIRCNIDLDPRLIQEANFAEGKLSLYDGAKDEPIPGLRLLGPDGRELPHIIHGAVREQTMVLDPFSLPRVYEVARYDVTFLVENVPGFGYATIGVEPGNTPAAGVSTTDSALTQNSGWQMENQYLKVSVGHNGCLDVLDKSTGNLYRNLLLFEDSGDAGDEYTYSPPPTDTILTTTNSNAVIEWVEKNDLSQRIRITHDFEIPESLTGDRSARHGTSMSICRIETEVALRAGSRRLDLKIRVSNLAMDHRLRVLFPSGVVASESWSEAHFDVMRRPISIPEPPEWSEKPLPQFPTKGFVAVQEDKPSPGRGLAVVTKGLHEYEVVERPDPNELHSIAITLLRCVGWLSRNDLLTRKGHAGWPIPTPGAQCKGDYTFELSVIPYSGTWQDAGIQEQAYQFSNPPAPVQQSIGAARRTSSELLLPSSHTLVSVTPGDLVMTTIKRSEDDTGTVIRTYNRSEKPVSGTIKFGLSFSKAYLARMDEQVIDVLPVNEDGTITVNARPKQIVTIKLIDKVD